MKPHRHRILLLWLTALSLGFLATVSHADAKPSQDAPCSVAARNAPLSTVLAQLARASGYTIRVNPARLSDPVTIRFQDVPFRRALRRVLQDYNYVLVFDPQERTVIVHILGKANTSDKRGQEITSVEESGDLHGYF